MPRLWDREAAGQYGFAVVCVGVATIARMAVDHFLGLRSPFLLFGLALVFSAWRSGWRGGVLSTVLAAATARYLFIEPRYQVAGLHPSDTVLTILFTITGLVISWIMQNWRSANDRLLRREADLAKVNAELRRTNQDLEAFAYAVSHDLRTPLSGIRVSCELLREECPESTQGEAAVLTGHIQTNVDQMTRLIDGLLEYSRAKQVDAARSTVCDPNEALDRVLAALQTPLAQNDAKITRDQLPPVRVDAERLVQVFENLIGNALKYRSAAPPLIHVSGQAVDGTAIFAVQDNGIGFDAAQAERIFEPFQRLHSQAKYPGSGVGLAIVKRIVERQGGRVWAESAPNEGATFYFTLPAAAALAPPPVKAAHA